ncbi:helix-turn-helix domain-containing protein [Paenibacillus radicis (ex Xue et al. 2023)]|uniref:Helix-turn-helix domain-containing protein n=1 Tax=Paenibacillus radicis (ex Xue et al. 2023) TaxID=2972489 RepID=A0ABT1YJT2_9BACL|nr:helix-turn-helix domain-containing protein [Paenibacillus radicis (ex Xue et al. 2023)]MCR8633443.1 helix-turn-helix domain-containing protein [Paenibacillus radicis (ex Xue et al. 2023)]
MLHEKMFIEAFNAMKAELRKELLEELRAEMTVQPERTLYIDEAAEYTRISEKVLYKMCQQKLIPHRRAGEQGSRRPRILFSTASLDAWNREQEKANCSAWE